MSENDIKEFIQNTQEEAKESAEFALYEKCYKKIETFKEGGLKIDFSYGWLCGFFQGILENEIEFFEAKKNIIYPAMIRVYKKDFFDYMEGLAK